MKILFIHQNFPGQFKFLAPALAARGHEVKAFKLTTNDDVIQWQNISIYNYKPVSESTSGVHPWAADFETKVIRGHSCLLKAKELKDLGYYPDLIISHPGWGESLFLKDIWPKSKLGVYCEFYYGFSADINFDPEFPTVDPFDSVRVTLKNMISDMHFKIADRGISPTKWQASTFPNKFSSKISVIHDGIDTDLLIPNNLASILLSNKIKLTADDQILTFVNRNLEPYRGYHIFMRSLPKILSTCPNLRVLIVGGDDISYGAKSPDGRSWKEIFANEILPSLTPQQSLRVNFLGTVPYATYISILQISIVHVYLTYPFVLSWSLLEAMSLGCSVIASNTQPVIEVIKDNENGLLFDFFNYDDLSTKVIDLLKNSELRKKLSTNARDLIIKNYDLKKVCLPKQIEWVESFF